MSGWIAVVAAIVGAAIAIGGQLVQKRLDRRREDSQAFLDQCAAVIALEEDFRNRLWEERKLGADGSVSAWGLSEYRLAEARLRLMSPGGVVLEALAQLRAAGASLGKIWRVSRIESDDLEKAWSAHRKALDQFIAVAGEVVRS